MLLAEHTGVSWWLIIFVQRHFCRDKTGHFYQEKLVEAVENMDADEVRDAGLVFTVANVC